MSASYTSNVTIHKFNIQGHILTSMSAQSNDLGHFLSMDKHTKLDSFYCSIMKLSLSEMPRLSSPAMKILCAHDNMLKKNRPGPYLEKQSNMLKKKCQG